ncbi:MAG: hypothetical protein AAGE88_07970 [Actinomycetota bacterium]
MSEQDVKDQLSRYGDWLKQSYALELVPPDRPDVVERIASPWRRRIRPVALAAAAVLAVVAVPAMVLQGEPAGLVVAAAPHDPTEPLYVLVEPQEAATVRNASVAEAGDHDVGLAGEIIVVGRVAEDETYVDLATIWVDGPTPQLDAASRPLDLASGPAEVWDDVFTVVVQDRGGTTIRVMADGGRADYAATILDSTTIDSSGSAAVDTSGPIDVIEASTFGESPTHTTTYFEVASEVTTDGGPLVVETATLPSPLLGAGVFGGELSATRVRDVRGWRLTRLDADGEWNGVAWQATPSHVIAVSGHAPYAVVRELAESLTIVTEDTWKAALPNHTTE